MFVGGRGTLGRDGDHSRGVWGEFGDFSAFFSTFFGRFFDFRHFHTRDYTGVTFGGDLRVIQAVECASGVLWCGLI